MESCAICGKIVNNRDSNHNITTAQPHTQCASCKSIMCAECATVEQCPICGYDGKN
ncbi:MAG: hypothetical protein NWE95_06980 [Candidatus Bathyarchaeota archaeon]|nr:hypothetical protein [Candidatus Bathyarchaeota archaeon]